MSSYLRQGLRKDWLSLLVDLPLWDTVNSVKGMRFVFANDRMA
jgi:hypothetical protein